MNTILLYKNGSIKQTNTDHRNKYHYEDIPETPKLSKVASFTETPARLEFFLIYQSSKRRIYEEVGIEL